jgi:MFS family permease
VAEAPGEDPGQRGNKWWTLVAVCLGTFMLLLDITIVNVALPDIQRALNSSFSDLQWIVDAYALTLAAFLLTAGSLADMFGRRLLYLVGLAVFTFASVLCGFAVSTVMLQLSRALQGVGGAIMFAVSLALLADSFRGKDRGVAFGAWGAVTGLAVAIGPLLGGVLTSGLSWRWIFFVNAPIGIAAVIIALAKVAESRGPGQPARLARLRALHGGAVEPGLRAHRVEPAVLHRRPGPWLPRRGGRAARRLRHRRATQCAADVRHEAV